MVRISYEGRTPTVAVAVGGLDFPARTLATYQYDTSREDYSWHLNVEVDPLQGVAASPILEDGDVVVVTLPTGGPLTLPITPSSPNKFQLQGNGYPPFLPADEPPEGRERPSEDSLSRGRQAQSFGYIIRDGGSRAQLIQHINAVLARLEEAEPEDEWEKELIAQATALATELRELILSERPASEYLADRSHSQRLIGGLMNFARLVEAKGGAALAKTPIVNAVLQLGQKATEVNL